MLQLDPTTQASLEAATTPSARAAAIVSSLSGTITVTVRDGTGATKGSGTMASFGTLSANVIVLSNVTTFTVSETGTPDPATWTIEFANAGGRFVKGTFGLYTSPVAEFKWSLATWENGQSGTIASAYCTVRKNEVLTDITDTFNVAATPANTAPVWTTGTPASLSLAAGATYNFASHAYDADGNTLTFSKVSGTGTVASNGIFTAGATSGSVTIQVSDGILTASATCAVTVSASAPFAPSYPRTAVYWIGPYNWTSSMVATAAKFQVTILPHYPQASYTNYATITALGTAIKAVNPDVKLLPYTILVEVGIGGTWSTFNSKLLAESCGSGGDWYLRNAAGTQVSTYANTYRVNHTRYVDPDSNGDRWAQYLAKYYNTSWGAGPFDGVYHDVVYSDGAAFSITADWNEDGVNDLDTSSAIQSATAQGHADYVTKWRELQPSYLVVANFLDFSRYTADPQLDQLYDGGLQEFAMGLSWSVEEWGGWAQMMTWYRTAIARCRDPKIAILHITDDYLVSQYGFSPYRCIRYGLCSALMDNGWFAYSSAENHTNTIWADEYNWNLGQPTETPRTSAYSNGVYVRQFANGLAIVNPKGNGSKTITLPSAGSGKRWDRLSGSQDSTVNNGATNVTSVTLNERDGLILKRVNA